MQNGDQITYLAETDFRNGAIKFGIKDKDRSKHIYVIGKTGMGKSTLLENMAIQDIRSGKGMAFIDPHGQTAEKLLDYIPSWRMKDVIYFAPHDTSFPIAFNPLEDVDKDKRHLVADGLLSAFKKIWPDVWSARMEYILSNTLLALIEYPDATLMGVNRMLSDKAYRTMVVNNVSDPSVRAFWVDEFANYTERMAAEAVPAIQNKIGQFTSNPIIRNIMGQSQSSFDLRKVMDRGKILIMNLSKGQMGEINASLVGGMLITKIYLAAMSRAGATESELSALPNFYFYVDEFQSFVNDSFADILSEARKYKLSLTIAHQYVEQMPETVRDAVFGNVGTTISFRVGPFDAEVLEKVFAPKFTMEDLVNLTFAQIYLTLMIDGVGSPPFSAKTLSPLQPDAPSLKQEIIEYVRQSFARPRADVEAAIVAWHQTMPDGTPAPVVEKKKRKRKKRGGSGGGGGMSESGGNGFSNQGSSPSQNNNGGPSLADLLDKAMQESGKTPVAQASTQPQRIEAQRSVQTQAQPQKPREEIRVPQPQQEAQQAPRAEMQRPVTPPIIPPVPPKSTENQAVKKEIPEDDLRNMLKI